jgi:hypothetical protein
VRNLLLLLSLWLGLATAVLAADTLTLTDGTTVSGDIIKIDDSGLMFHTTTETYATVLWSKFTQDSLKQLSDNPKINKAYIEPFLDPTPADHPSKPEIKANPVTRMDLPEHPSLFGGLLHSSLGLFILLVIYGANLYAAYEIAVVRGKSIGAAIGLSAVLPLIGPVIFLTQPIKADAPPEETGGEGLPGADPAAPAPGSPAEEIQIVSASWQGGAPEEKKPQPQVFARGKFTFNKRFVETKFAGFIGEPKGEALHFTMALKTLKAQLTVERIMQVTPNEVILETPNGQVTVPFADILEVSLNPKTA